MLTIDRKRVHLSLAMIVALGLACQAMAAPQAPAANLISVKGLVKVRSAGGRWRQAVLPQSRRLWARDEVQTHQHASAQITLGAATLKLGPLTHVVIPALQPGKTSYRSRLQVLAGKLLILLIGARPLEIGTAGATASARGTVFLVEVGAADLTTLTVLEGSVDFYNDAGTVLVNANEQSTAAPGRAPSRPMRVDPSSFIDWEASPDSLWLGFEKLQRPDLTGEQRRMELDKAAAQAQANPNDPAALTAYGDLLHDSGSYEQAEEAYEAALRVGATLPDALRLKLAYTLLAQGKNTEAAALLAQIQDPALQGLTTAGRGIAALGNPTDANIAEARRLADEALKLKPAEAEVAVMAGFVYLRSGEAEPAIAALQKAMQLDPNEYRAPAYLAMAQLAARQGPAALQTANAAVKAAPGSGLVHEALATAAFYAGSLDQAEAEIALALVHQPNSATAHLLAAQVAAARGDLQSALHETELALSLNPHLAQVYQTLGVLSLALNDVARAEKAFRKAMELQPRLGSAMTGLGQVLARQDKFREAEQAQQAAVALDPGAAAAHNNLGAAYLQTGRLQEAVGEFEQALKLQPAWALVHGNLALAYLEMNRFAEAIEEGELAVKLGAQSARVHTTLARVYLRQDRVNKAWAALRRALELDPNYALARMHLAEVYVRLGLDRDANRERLRAMSQQPSVMVDNRSYARTEVTAAAGSITAQAFTSGRGDDGQNSYYVAGRHQEDDWDRPRTDFEDNSALAFFGRQTSPDNTVLLVGNLERDERDRPGRVVGADAPTDLDYTSRFNGSEFQILSRVPGCGDGSLTFRAGYRTATLHDDNPDSLMPDPNPLRRIRLGRREPMGEVRFDQDLSYGDTLVAGLAVAGQRREIDGLLSMLNPPPLPVSYTPFASADPRTLLSGYVDWENRLNDRTRLLIGGRMALADDAQAVFRPRVSLRHKTSAQGTLVLLTRPILADDVSELSPVDEWGTRFWLSPVDLARGGYSQSYEAQFELQPADGSLLRVAAFHRELRNLIVDLEDPAWSVEAAPVIVGEASMHGVEAEYERWLTRHLTGGAWVRWIESDNDDAGGLDIPYQPTLVSQARLDYINEDGWRAALIWQHIGRRYADIANTTRLDSFDLLHLRLARQFSLHKDVFVTVENLLDEEHEFFLGYPGRDRRFSGGVRYRF